MVLPARHFASMGSIRFHHKTFPCGRVTTYEDFCAALEQGSPRSGPFVTAPISSWFSAWKQPLCYVRSLLLHHRIIGRFFGEWGTGAKARGGQRNTALQCDRKMDTCIGRCNVLCGRWVSCRRVSDWAGRG